MNIAVITGASSGLGVEFYKEMQKEDLDEIWIMARREGKLDEVAEKYGKIKTRVVAMDITARENIEKYSLLLKEENPNIKFLINNAGFGTIGNLDEADYRVQGDIVNLNVRALTEITAVSLHYMQKGSKIINSCSIASFVPNARMTVYSASKAYVLSFTKSLRYELKKRGINVTAVCPGPMSTEFLEVAGIDKGVSKTFDTLPYCDPEKVARLAVKASKKGRCVCTPRAFYKFYRFLAKVLPHSWLMGASKT